MAVNLRVFKHKWYWNDYSRVCRDHIINRILHSGLKAPDKRNSRHHVVLTFMCSFGPLYRFSTLVCFNPFPPFRKRMNTFQIPTGLHSPQEASLFSAEAASEVNSKSTALLPDSSGEGQVNMDRLSGAAQESYERSSMFANTPHIVLVLWTNGGSYCFCGLWRS